MARKTPAPPAGAAPGPADAALRPRLGWCGRPFASASAADRFCPACRKRRSTMHTSARDDGRAYLGPGDLRSENP